MRFSLRFNVKMMMTMAHWDVSDPLLILAVPHQHQHHIVALCALSSMAVTWASLDLRFVIRVAIHRNPSSFLSVLHHQQQPTEETRAGGELCTICPTLIHTLPLPPNWVSQVCIRLSFFARRRRTCAVARGWWLSHPGIQWARSAKDTPRRRLLIRVGRGLNWVLVRKTVSSTSKRMCLWPRHGFECDAICQTTTYREGHVACPWVEDAIGVTSGGGQRVKWD